MNENKDACIYNGVEYILTGRKAVKRKGNTRVSVHELRPKFNGGFGDDLNIWVAPSELYLIIDEDSDE